MRGNDERQVPPLRQLVAVRKWKEEKTMADIKLTLYTQGGDAHEIEAPADIRGNDLVKDLATQLQLPATDADGNAVAWRLDDKDTGKTLNLEMTLADNGVQAGHRLSLLRQVTAG
jgi:hypothetical protein